MRSARIKADLSGVSRLLDDLVSASVLPGANVLLLKGGAEIHYHQAGLQDVASSTPLTRDTLFRVYSMTKPVTAAAVMILVDEGALSLDQDVAGLLPELSALRVYAGEDGDLVRTVLAGPMTVKDLLTHTAGFSYWFQPASPVAALYDAIGAGRHEQWRFMPDYGGLAGFVRSLADIPLVCQPGERWHYGLSIDVAGLLVERASGQPLDAFMEARIFAPLDMKDTGFSVSRENAARLASLYGPTPEGGLELLESGLSSPLLRKAHGFAGGGGLVSTADDFARFAAMLVNGGEYDGSRILSAASVGAMTSNQLGAEKLAELPMLAAFGLGGSGGGLGFGLGGAVVVDPARMDAPTPLGEYAWGGAASTTFWADPENDLAVVFMTQVAPPSSEMLRDKLHAAIYDRAD